MHYAHRLLFPLTVELGLWMDLDLLCVLASVCARKRESESRVTPRAESSRDFPGLNLTQELHMVALPIPLQCVSRTRPLQVFLFLSL